MKWMSTCALCGAPSQGGLLCCPCDLDLPRLGDARCHRCAAPLPARGLCGACQKHPADFDRVTAAFAYQYPVDAMIRRVKYRGELHWLQPLIRELVARIEAEGPPRAVRVLPVPQHARRRLARSFNQSLEIARLLGGRLGIAVDDRLLCRSRMSPPQTGLSAAARAQNVRGAFGVRKEILDIDSVALVDDVLTTGATARELSRMLKRAGVREVRVWCVARAPGPGT